MQTNSDIKIIQAEHCHIGGMAHIFLNSFDLDASVKLMYTKGEIGPVIQEILHDYMDDNQIDFRLAVTRDTGLLAGWISFGIIPAKRPVPQYAFNEMTSWAAHKLLGGNMMDHRCRLAVELENKSRKGQSLHMSSHRLVINTIVTDPKYRRLAIAGMLLRFAVDRAKSVDCGIWAQTPSVYVGLFWQNGFHEVGTFGLDLNAFKPPEEVAMGIQGKQLGIQTWRQMKLATRAELQLEKERARIAEAGSTLVKKAGPSNLHAGSWS